MAQLRRFTVRQSHFPFTSPSKVLGTVTARDLRAARELAKQDPRFAGQSVTVEYEQPQRVSPAPKGRR